MMPDVRNPNAEANPKREGQSGPRDERVDRHFGLPSDFGLATLVSDAGQQAGLDFPMRLVRKRGQPFLFLPCDRRAAATCLELYPAQTARARAARNLLRFLLLAGLPVGTEKLALKLRPDSPFIGFLGSTVTAATSPPPLFGVLVGNPNTPGQRFLVLVFDRDRRPAGVVKAGFTERARELIQTEASFLSTISGKLSGIPTLRGAFQSTGVRALALEFFAGDSPAANDTAGLSALLTSWVDHNRRSALAEAPDWARLEQAAGADETFAAIAGRLHGRTIQATVSHGDLAPWNIKVTSRGHWVVLDWERGEQAGVPGWDWFHYLLQPAILVDRATTTNLIERLNALLDAELFRAYAQHTGISGLERLLALTYLYHCLYVIKPSEGLQATRQLLDALRARWSR